MTTYAPLLEKPEEPVKLHLEPTDAIKMVRRLRRVRFFIRSNVDLVTQFDDDGNPTRCYQDMGGNIPVSAAVAVEMLNTLDDFNQLKAKKGDPTGLVMVSRYGDCVFFN